MTQHEYLGLKVIQQDGSPPFYMTSIPALELLAWCDVPRAKGDYMAGYQRSLNDKRSGALADYLKLSPRNIVPGAVIVAVDSDYLEVQDRQGASLLRVLPDSRDFKTKLEELFGGFTSRMTSEELESADITFAAADWDGGEDDEEEGSEYPRSYLASLARELNGALTDWDGLPQKRREAITDYIDGVSKPGLIIDGQHRVFGAAGVSGRQVRLPVVLLPGLEYAEQVFQFYVLNSKAKPLKPTELRRIVSTSLTNQEIADLYDRFRQAGITAEEARWTLEMDTRPESPFRNRVDFGYDNKGTVIKENVADQVVRAFMKMPKRRYGQLIKPLGDQWSDLDSRLELFFAFWDAVKQHYADTWETALQAADEGLQHNLFLKVSLLTLQRFLLDRFVTALPFRAEAPPPLSSPEEIKKMVASALTYLPGEFFEREWKLKQIDTSPGRLELYASMEAVYNNQGKIHGNMKLFRG